MGTIKLFEIPIYALSEKKLKEKVHQKEENLREKSKTRRLFSTLGKAPFYPLGAGNIIIWSV